MASKLPFKDVKMQYKLLVMCITEIYTKRRERIEFLGTRILVSESESRSVVSDSL